MINLAEFRLLCQEYEEVWVIQEGSIFHFKDGAIRIAHIKPPKGGC